MSETMSAQRDKLIQDLRLVINDAEALLKSGSEQMGNGATEWRLRTQDRLTQLRQQIASLQAQTANGLRTATRTTNEFVQHNPWTAVGVASGLGLLAGYLMNNRR